MVYFCLNLGGVGIVGEYKGLLVFGVGEFATQVATFALVVLATFVVLALFFLVFFLVTFAVVAVLLATAILLNGDADVVVANGLMGNVALKSIEGTAKIMKNALMSEFKKNILNKLFNFSAVLYSILYNLYKR